jgi:adenylate cyclase, class 2
MEIEFEAKFLGVDFGSIRRQLKKLGAKRVKPETLMRRVVFEPPKTMEGGWCRVRDEGDKITLSLKQVSGDRIHDQREVCLEINDFDQGVRLFESLGAKRKAYQETKREIWVLGGAEICLDTWPGLNPYMEIEGKNERAVKAAAKQLGLDYSKALFGSADMIYERELGIPRHVINNEISEVTFANPPKRFK